MLRRRRTNQPRWLHSTPRTTPMMPKKTPKREMKSQAMMMPRNETAVDVVEDTDTETETVPDTEATETETEPDMVDMEDTDADVDAVATTNAATPITATTATTTKCATITPTMCATSTAVSHADVVVEDTAEDTEASERDLLSSLPNQHTSSKPQKFSHTLLKMSTS